MTKAGAYEITRNAVTGLPEAVSDAAAGGALNIARAFNAFGELDGQTYTVNGQQAFAWNIARDAAGRITRKTETTRDAATGLPVSIVYDYTYDDLGRLLTVKANDTLVEEYRYNTQGARIYEMNSRRGITGRSYEYSIEDHLLRAGDTSYQYDADGFLTRKTENGQVTLYNYSSRGELLRVDLPDGRVLEYLNDPQGRRIAKKINGQIVEKYLWQGLTRLLAVYDANNVLLHRYEYGDERTPLAVVTGGQKYLMHYDQVGTLRAMTDSAGVVVKEVTYDSFGNVLGDTRPGISYFAFAGGLYDGDTGLVRFGYRDYDAKVGGWTAKDPIGFEGGLSGFYAYCSSDPIDLIDEDGKYAVPATIVFAPLLIWAIYNAVDGTRKALESQKPAKDKQKDTDSCPKTCPPCRLADGTAIPAGSIAYRFDLLSPNVQQHGIYGGHLNLYRANQNPYNCQCFCQPAGTVAPPPQLGWIPIQPFAN